MTSPHGTVIETIVAFDRKSTLEFILRDDGYYEYCEHYEVTEDETEWGAGIFTYWQFRTSGLYQTLELAKADAVRMVLWLRDET